MNKNGKWQIFLMIINVKSINLSRALNEIFLNISYLMKYYKINAKVNMFIPL